MTDSNGSAQAHNVLSPTLLDARCFSPSEELCDERLQGPLHTVQKCVSSKSHGLIDTFPPLTSGLLLPGWPATIYHRVCYQIQKA